MDVSTGLVAVIPAGPEVSWEAVAESIRFTSECPEIVKTVVVSSQSWRERSNEAGAWFLESGPEIQAPAPRIPLLASIIDFSEREDGAVVRLLMHLDPKKPIHDPLVVYECLQRLLINGLADGVIGVSAGGKGLAERDGWLTSESQGKFVIDGSLFVLRAPFVAERPSDWFSAGRFLPYHTAPAEARPRGGLL